MFSMDTFYNAQQTKSTGKRDGPRTNRRVSSTKCSATLFQTVTIPATHGSVAKLVCVCRFARLISIKLLLVTRPRKKSTIFLLDKTGPPQKGFCGEKEQATKKQTHRDNSVCLHIGRIAMNGCPSVTLVEPIIYKYLLHLIVLLGNKKFLFGNFCHNIPLEYIVVCRVFPIPIFGHSVLQTKRQQPIIQVFW